MNKWMVTGRLTRDPELKYTPSGTAVCTFSIAVNRPFKKDETDFFDCVAWRSTAEYIGNYGTKGRLMEIEGRGQARTYETKEGQKRKVVELVVDQCKFLDKQGESSGARSGSVDDRGYVTDARNMGGTIDPWDDLGREVKLEDINMAEEEIPF